MVHFAYMPSPIPRQVRWKFVRSYIPSTSAFPETGAGRLLHHYFRGLLSVHLRYGLHARQVAFATLYTRGFSSLVASPAALIATGWSEPVPGRVYPRCGPAPSRRTRLALPGVISETAHLLVRAKYWALASALKSISLRFGGLSSAVALRHSPTFPSISTSP
jgi:hypothetical protein